ncbi:MAG: c-type cytochrome biogenesis protein CcsB, partial [Micromonosporaceae bacterium]|nr:c-type cytochrome biogenesis protein CcsB [Micromonosporaceae bacterium]
MAGLSDHLLALAIVGYALAMLCYAGEYAFSSRGVVARVAVRERELVGAGAPVEAAPPEEPELPAAAPGVA